MTKQSKQIIDPGSHRHSLRILIVMLSTFLSRLLGFVRIAVIGALFGASGTADVLHLVFNIPNNLRKLLAEGALASAFIPVISANVQHNDRAPERNKSIVQALLGFQIIVLAPLLALVTIYPGPIIDLILDFQDSAQSMLGKDLLRLMGHYLLLVSIGAVLMATLHAHERFLIPAVTPMLFSIAVIGAMLLWNRSLGIFSVGVGVLIGGILQILFQIPAYVRIGYRILPKLNFKDPDFLRILRQWLPVVATASIFTINQQIAFFFASGLTEGSGSAMANALVFWHLPFGIIANSVMTVFFPTMSKQAAANDQEGLGHSLQFGLRYLWVMLIPSGIILTFLGPEIIAVTLQRGAFNPENSRLAADVLGGYCWGLFSVAGFNFLQRFCYARRDYRGPVIAATVTLLLDVGLSLWLKETYLGVVGLSIANSIAFSIGFVVLLITAHDCLSSVRWKHIGSTIVRTLPALVCLTAFAVLYSSVSANRWSSGSDGSTLVRLCLAGIGACALTFLLYKLFRVSPLPTAGRSAQATRTR